MLSEHAGPVEAATAFADRFVEAGVAKLDAVLGAGYARENPQAVAAYMAACASNLNAFMNAAIAIDADTAFDEALASIEEELPPPPPDRKGRGRRR